MVRSYANRYGVDLICAIIELQLLGVAVDPQYVEAIRTSHQRRPAGKKASREKPDDHPHGEYGLDWDDNFAYIVGRTSGGFAFGVTWKEWESMEASEAEAIAEFDELD